MSAGYLLFHTVVAPPSKIKGDKFGKSFNLTQKIEIRSGDQNIKVQNERNGQNDMMGQWAPCQPLEPPL